MGKVRERAMFGMVITTEKIKASRSSLEPTDITKVLGITIIDRLVKYVSWLHDEIKSSCSLKL